MPLGSGGRERDYVKTLQYEAQRQFSIDTIREAMDRVEVNAHDRAQREREMKKLENPTLCPPDVSQTRRSAPNVAEVQAGIDRLRDAAKYVVDASSVKPWTGKAQTGSFVDLGDQLVAQHIGRGAYTFMDVQEDLGGVPPPIGQEVSLNSSGQMELRDHTSGRRQLSWPVDDNYLGRLRA